jgi:hypothetical protein
VGLWVPVVLHWGWEAGDGFTDLQRLLDRIAPYAARWEDFRDAIARSRTQTASAAAGAEEPGEQRGPLAVDG